MACGCRKAGGASKLGAQILGFEVTYPDGTKAPGLFLTSVEAKREVRLRGGGTIRQITTGK